MSKGKGGLELRVDPYLESTSEGRRYNLAAGPASSLEPSALTFDCLKHYFWFRLRMEGGVGHCLSKLCSWDHITDFLRSLQSYLQSLCPCPSPAWIALLPGALLDLVQGSLSLVPGLRFDSFPNTFSLASAANLLRGICKYAKKEFCLSLQFAPMSDYESPASSSAEE